MTETKPVYESRKTKAMLRNELQAMRQNSTLTSRASLARGLGKSFGGKRDMYAVLGYPTSLTYDDFLNVYERDGLATRIVDAVSDETWRENPILIEGENKKKDELDEPSQLQRDFTELQDSLDLFSEFNDADAYCGISRFAVLVLGLPGNMAEPVERMTLCPDDLAFVIAHDEGSVQIASGDIESNPANARFGMPNYYTVVMDVDKGSIGQRIHWSRVIHIKEGRTKSRTYGVPRLQSMYNRIQDMEKVVGGGSEAFWLLIHRGIALSAKDGMTLPAVGSDAYKDMQDEIEEYEHGISRFMRLIGMDVTDLGGRPVDSDAQFRTIVSYLSGASRIPQRILIGSEAGHLASSQDEYNFASFIASRQKKFAEPKILRAFVDKCGDLGILNVPERYTVEWPSLFQLTDMEKAQLAQVKAGAISTITGGAPETAMPVADFMRNELDYVPEIPDPAEVLKPNDPSDPRSDVANIPVNKASLPEGVNLEALKPKSWSAYDNDLPEYEQLNTEPLKPINSSDPSKVSIFPIEVTTPAPTYDATVAKIVLSSKTLTIWHNEKDTDVMIAFRVPDSIRSELGKSYPFMGKEEKGNLHITLSYLGDNRSLDMEAVKRACKYAADFIDPVKVNLQGLARFISGKEKDPIVLTADSPKLPALHHTVAEALKREGVPYHEEHGYIPHTTLTYISKDAPMPLDTMGPLEVNFNEIYLVNGNEWTPFKMGTSAVEGKPSDTPFLNEGNADSGNHGHAGREGKVGGSAGSAGDGMSKPKVEFSNFRDAHLWALTQSSMFSGIDENESKVLDNYKRDSLYYKPVNAVLRGTEYDKTKFSKDRKRVDDFIATMDSAMETNSIPEDVVVYRAMESKAIPKRAKSFTDKGFVSTSLAPERGEGFLGFVRDNGGTPAMLKINVPKGTKGIYMEHLWDSAEAEILLNRGTKFKILSDSKRADGIRVVEVAVQNG